MSVRPWLAIPDERRGAGLSVQWFWDGDARLIGAASVFLVVTASTAVFNPRLRTPTVYRRVGSAHAEHVGHFVPLTARARAALDLAPSVARLVSEGEG